MENNFIGFEIKLSVKQEVGFFVLMKMVKMERNGEREKWGDDFGLGEIWGVWEKRNA